jgi:hypothetical protein
MDDVDGRHLHHTWSHLPAQVGSNGQFDFYLGWSLFLFTSIFHKL